MISIYEIINKNENQIKIKLNKEIEEEEEDVDAWCSIDSPFKGCSPFWLCSWLENWDSCLLWGLNAIFKKKNKKKRDFDFVLFLTCTANSI